MLFVPFPHTNKTKTPGAKNCVLAFLKCCIFKTQNPTGSVFIDVSFYVPVRKHSAKSTGNDTGRKGIEMKCIRKGTLEKHCGVSFLVLFPWCLLLPLNVNSGMSPKGLQSCYKPIEAAKKD